MFPVLTFLESQKFLFIFELRAFVTLIDSCHGALRFDANVPLELTCATHFTLRITFRADQKGLTLIAGLFLADCLFLNLH